ncbi:universal stress protein [Rhabdothermincola salaria]|uniref:universal stress protein n=1 Tax=Rhabdothermincola salaria TaxID=2903142 RepID=UPI001E4833D2|nr:universal stress protein [Rhabdothermincola salaria]MCD9623842.1 universal stress protein [Rhabdothermincola salaria]
MLRTFVVPLDESERAEAVLPLATELADAFGAEVVLVTAGWGRTAEALTAYHHDLAPRLGAVPWRSAVVPDTFPADAIRDLTPDDGAVVMTTKGRQGLARVVLGSVAEDVVGTAHRPVLLAGPSATVAPLTDGDLVVTCDGGELSSTVVDHAVPWAQTLGLSVRVVAVVHADGTPLGGGDPETLHHQLTESAEAFRSAGCPVHVERLVAKDAASALVDLARRLPATLVAMSTHARGGIARAALGSTTMAVVRDVSCPVLVYRPEG